MIWAIMKKKVDKLKPKNIEQLTKVLQYVWKKIDYNTINGLIDSFPKKKKKNNEMQKYEFQKHFFFF